MAHYERTADYGIEGREQLEREGRALLDRMTFGPPVFHVAGHKDILAGLPSPRHILVLEDHFQWGDRHPLNILLGLRFPGDSELDLYLPNILNISPITNYRGRNLLNTKLVNRPVAWAVRLVTPLKRFQANPRCSLFALERALSDALPLERVRFTPAPAQMRHLGWWSEQEIGDWVNRLVQPYLRHRYR